MYPSQPIAPEVPRYPAQPLGGTPGQAPRMMPRGPQTTGPRSDALASFVTYVKALESLDRRKFPDEYAEHADRIKELRPFLKAHGILDVMQIKNPEVATLLGV
ncbi:hypothetical protein K7711_34405 [Nocardia sp. CA2R105]|uniref:hypothetical protein n=1 Tax=Nocardia coffeae TaxID=2873381 RepID=UPI001CA7AE4C|nr:hypothetical protein [Nocardia coffeae]MBY8861611.1 hypothetical protein [Nocardia coffeae]